MSEISVTSGDLAVRIWPHGSMGYTVGLRDRVTKVALQTTLSRSGWVREAITVARDEWPVFASGIEALDVFEAIALGVLACEEE